MNRRNFIGAMIAGAVGLLVKPARGLVRGASLERVRAYAAPLKAVECSGTSIVLNETNQYAYTSGYLQEIQPIRFVKSFGNEGYSGMVEYRHGRPVITAEMAAKMNCPFPAGEDL